MSSSDGIRIGPIVTIGAVGVILTLVIVVALQAFVLREERAEFGRKVVDQPFRERQEMRLDQSEALDAYRWIDETKGIVAIPVDRAMEVVVREEAARADDRGR